MVTDPGGGRVDPKGPQRQPAQGEINVDFNFLPLDCKTSESTELLFAKLYIKAK